jgi:hypothetical protein
MQNKIQSNIITIFYISLWLCSPLLINGQNNAAVYSQIKKDVQKQRKFDMNHFLFKSVEVVKCFGPERCGNINTVFYSDGEDTNDLFLVKDQSVQEKTTLVSTINQHFDQFNSIFREMQYCYIHEKDYNPDYVNRLDVSQIFVVTFNEDTIIDVIVRGVDVAPTVYEESYHFVFGFPNFIFLGHFKSQFQYGDAYNPLGDYNNDGILDFLTYSWDDTIELYTLKKERFELVPNYYIGLNWDSLTATINILKTNVTMLLYGQWVSIP